MLLGLIGISCQAIEHVPIGRIQGSDHRSPYEGSTVSTAGIVTRVYKNGFIIQSSEADASPETSEAVYVFQKDTPVLSGSELSITGKVEEWAPGGEESYNLTLTQIRADKVRRIRNNVSLPKPIILNYLLAGYPRAVKLPGSPFDTARNALDFWEAMEHMRVVVLNATVVGPRTRFGEMAVRVPEGPAEPSTIRGGVKLTGYDFNPARVLVALSPDNVFPYNTGDRIRDTIHGNVTYSFGNYKVGSSKALSAPEPMPLPGAADFKIPKNALTLATFNVENLYPELPDEKFQSLAKIVVQSLRSPDILALQEIHDNSGPENNTVLNADQTLKKLIHCIELAGGPRYRFLQINPQNNNDGGWPGANIRNAYLYRNTMKLGKSYLLQDPVFNKSDSNGYSGTRKPLVAYFKHGEQKLIFINCHLKSKGGDSPTFGSLLPAVRFSDTQRIAQTRVIRSHLDQLGNEYPDAGIIVLGDMNDFEFSPSIENLTRGQGLINLVDTVPLADRYTYIYQGYSQVLDHILVSPKLADRTSTRILHLNADFSDGRRASDHDPILAWID